MGLTELLSIIETEVQAREYSSGRGGHEIRRPKELPTGAALLVDMAKTPQFSFVNEIIHLRIVGQSLELSPALSH